MHKKYNIQMKYTKSVLWTSCVVILLRDVSIAQQHLWLWQSVAIIIYCFSFCLWTLPSVYWVNIEWTHVELYDLSPINLRLWWMYHHDLLLVPLVALSPVHLREHAVNFISYKILFDEFKFRLWRKLLSLGPMISPLCFEFVSYVFLISGLNILFLAQTPLLYLFYFNTL